MVALIQIFIAVVYLQVHSSRGVGFIYKFVKRSTIPQVELGIDSRLNIFGASYKSDAL